MTATSSLSDRNGGEFRSAPSSPSGALYAEFTSDQVDQFSNF